MTDANILIVYILISYVFTKEVVSNALGLAGPWDWQPIHTLTLTYL